MEGYLPARLKVRFIASLMDGGFPMATSTGILLLDHFAALRDPRQHAKVLHPLPEILLLVLSATIAGAADFVETTRWGTQHLAFLRRFYRYESGIPSHDAMRRVRRTGSGVVQGLLPGLGQRPARRRRRHHRHRWEDLAAQPRQAEGPQPPASRLRLGGAATDRARAAGDRGEIQRDHRHSAVAEAPRSERCAGHYGCHGDADRHRPRDP